MRALCGRRKAAFGAKPVALIFADISRGVAHMHDKKVLHRDLHVGNILVDNKIKRNGEIQVHELKATKIADFGKAIEFGTAASPGTYLKGTATCGVPEIIPPEIWFRSGIEWASNAGLHGMRHIATNKPRRAKYTGALDVWAVGIDLLRVLNVELCGGSLGSRGASAVVAVFGKISKELIGGLKWSVPNVFQATLLVKRGVLSLDELGVFAFVFKEMTEYDPRTRVAARVVAEMCSVLTA